MSNEFISWADLTPKQKESVRAKWPREKAGGGFEREHFLYNFTKDGHAFASRMIASTAEKSPSLPPLFPVPEPDRIVQVALNDLTASPLNPRKRYDSASLQGLAENLRELGVIHALLVRPAHPQTLAKYEVIAGHRRQIAASIAGLATVPVVVREISDTAALELMLSENLQREDLNPIEEADGIRLMLELEQDGIALYTRETAAAKLGRSANHLLNALRLLTLPEAVRAALEEGKIGASIGYLIAKVPTAAMRMQLFASVMEGYGDGPLSKREVQDLIRRDYMVELRGAPFPQGDAKLYPACEIEGVHFGGSCKDCPLNSANMEDVDGKMHLCTNPSCFQAKVEAYTKAVREKALDAGHVIVEGKKAAELVYHDGTPAFDSGMVALEAQPAQSEVTGDKKPPTWKKMLSGKVTPRVTVVINEKGRVTELVPRKLAIEAAKKNGYDHLFTARAGRATSSEHADQLARQQSENEAQKIQRAVAFAALEEVVDAVEQGGKPGIPVDAFLEVALHHAGADGEWMVIKRRGLEVKKTTYDQPDRAGAIRAHAATCSPMQVKALGLELLLAGWMKGIGIESKPFLAIAKAYNIDVPEVAAKAKSEMGIKPRKKKAGKEGLTRRHEGTKGKGEESESRNALYERGPQSIAVGTPWAGAVESALSLEWSVAPDEFCWMEDGECGEPQKWHLDFPKKCGDLDAWILVAQKDGRWYAGIDCDDDDSASCLVLPDLEQIHHATCLGAAQAALVMLGDVFEAYVEEGNKYDLAHRRVDEYLALVRRIEVQGGEQIPVSDVDALGEEKLSDDDFMRVYEMLQGTGANGMTVRQLADDLSLPYSAIYCELTASVEKGSVLRIGFATYRVNPDYPVGAAPASGPLEVRPLDTRHVIWATGILDEGGVLLVDEVAEAVDGDAAYAQRVIDAAAERKAPADDRVKAREAAKEDSGQDWHRDFVGLMKEAKTADEGRPIISRFERAVQGLCEVFGMKPLCGQIEPKYYRGASCTSKKEWTAGIKEASGIDSDFRDMLDELALQQGPLQKAWDALYAKVGDSRAAAPATKSARGKKGGAK